MLLATGGSRPAGIEGWVPVNTDIAAALEGAAGGERAASDGESQLKGNVMPADKAETVGSPSATMLIADAQAPGVGSGTAASDGQQLTMSTAGGSNSSENAAGMNQPRQVVDSSLISINQAGLLELQDIPGIGEKKAKAIMDYRDAHGGFASIEELTEVKGIGDKMLDKMKPYIRL